eukprot:Awhi_evm1s10136
MSSSNLANLNNNFPLTLANISESCDLEEILDTMGKGFMTHMNANDVMKNEISRNQNNLNQSLARNVTNTNFNFNINCNNDSNSDSIRNNNNFDLTYGINSPIKQQFTNAETDIYNLKKETMKWDTIHNYELNNMNLRNLKTKPPIPNFSQTPAAVTIGVSTNNNVNVNIDSNCNLSLLNYNDHNNLYNTSSGHGQPNNINAKLKNFEDLEREREEKMKAETTSNTQDSNRSSLNLTCNAGIDTVGASYSKLKSLLTRRQSLPADLDYINSVPSTAFATSTRSLHYTCTPITSPTISNCNYNINNSSNYDANDNYNSACTTPPLHLRLDNLSPVNVSNSASISNNDTDIELILSPSSSPGLIMANCSNNNSPISSAFDMDVINFLTQQTMSSS